MICAARLPDSLTTLGNNPCSGQKRSTIQQKATQVSAFHTRLETSGNHRNAARAASGAGLCTILALDEFVFRCCTTRLACDAEKCKLQHGNGILGDSGGASSVAV